MKFSVIVPIYNAEKVLQRCIDSVLNQSVTDFELILVDDGSKDNSGSICDQNAALDSRIRVVHQENSGVSTARNKGIDISRGGRIIFLDSDDYVDPNFLENFNRKSEDLLISGYQIEGFGISEVKKREFQEQTWTDISQKQTADLFEQGMFNYVWAKAFDGDIIRRNSLHFDPHLNYAEDTLFAVQYVSYCKSISILRGSPYHYVKYEHETLTGGNLLSENMIQKIETSNDRIAAELNCLLGDSAAAVTARRMAPLYKEIIGTLVHHPETPITFILFLFRQKWFRLTLNYADQFYADEALKFRRLLKCKSGFLFWLYLKTRR